MALALAIFVSVSLAVALNLPPDVDEIANLEVSRNLFNGYHTDTVYTEWKFWHHPPMYYVMLFLFSSNYIYARVLSIVVSCFTILILYKLGNGKAQLLYATIPSVLIFSAVIRPDVPMMLFMLLTLLLAEKHPKIALIISVLGINTKYQYVAALFPILLTNKKRFVKFVIVDLIALIPFGYVTYTQSGDFLMLEHWTEGLGFHSLTAIIPTDLMLIFMSLVIVIASCRVRDARGYLLLSIVNLLLITLTSPAKFAYKVTYYYLPVFAVASLAFEKLSGTFKSKKLIYLLVALFLAIVFRQSRFLTDILIK